MTINQLCGEKIKEARTNKNMTIEELAYQMNSEKCDDIVKKIKYWEKGNGFPDLDQIYQLSEILELDPNLLFKLRENGRKSLSDAKQLTEKQVKRRERIDANFDDFGTYFPALVMVLVVVLLLKGPQAIIGFLYSFFYKISSFLGLVK